MIKSNLILKSLFYLSLIVFYHQAKAQSSSQSCLITASLPTPIPGSFQSKINILTRIIKFSMFIHINFNIKVQIIHHIIQTMKIVAI